MKIFIRKLFLLAFFVVMILCHTLIEHPGTGSARDSAGGNPVWCAEDADISRFWERVKKRFLRK